MIKKLLLPALSVLVIFYSCKKGNDTPGQPDPVKTSDTAYLIKSEISYTYNVGGNGETDSTIFTWTYDSKRRPVIHTARYPNGEIDSFTYSYSATQDVTKMVASRNAIYFLEQSEDIVFHQASGRVDSTFYSSVTLLSGVSTTNSYMDYKFYDSHGNNTVDSTFSLLPGKLLNGWQLSSFADNSLVSQSAYFSNGHLSTTVHYQGGNIVSDTVYNYATGAIDGTSAFTYLPTLSGGLFMLTHDVNLRATFTQMTVQVGGPLVSQTAMTYTFDDLNRVNSITYSYNGLAGGKEVYSY